MTSDGEARALHVGAGDVWSDLRSYLGRAHAAGADAARFVGVGGAVVVLTSVRGNHGATPVCGMRISTLATPWSGDATAEVAAWNDRLAREPEDGILHVPPVEVPGGPDIAVMPPQHGWRRGGVMGMADATGLGWDETIPLAIDVHVPAGMLHTAAALGFASGPVGVTVATCAGWMRVTARHGHVLARSAL